MNYTGISYTWCDLTYFWTLANCWYSLEWNGYFHSGKQVCRAANTNVWTVRRLLRKVPNLTGKEATPPRWTETVAKIQTGRHSEIIGGPPDDGTSKEQSNAFASKPRMSNGRSRTKAEGKTVYCPDVPGTGGLRLHLRLSRTLTMEVAAPEYKWYNFQTSTTSLDLHNV